MKKKQVHNPLINTAFLLLSLVLVISLISFQGFAEDASGVQRVNVHFSEAEIRHAMVKSQREKDVKDAKEKLEQVRSSELYQATFQTCRSDASFNERNYQQLALMWTSFKEGGVLDPNVGRSIDSLFNSDEYMQAMTDCYGNDFNAQTTFSASVLAAYFSAKLVKDALMFKSMGAVFGKVSQYFNFKTGKAAAGLTEAAARKWTIVGKALKWMGITSSVVGVGSAGKMGYDYYREKHPTEKMKEEMRKKSEEASDELNNFVGNISASATEALIKMKPLLIAKQDKIKEMYMQPNVCELQKTRLENSVKNKTKKILEMYQNIEAAKQELIRLEAAILQAQKDRSKSKWALVADLLANKGIGNTVISYQQMQISQQLEAMSLQEVSRQNSLLQIYQKEVEKMRVDRSVIAARLRSQNFCEQEIQLEIPQEIMKLEVMIRENSSILK